MEFIEGKWYKNPGDFPGANITYGRFLKWENCCWYFTEYINNGVLEVPLKSTWWAYEDGKPVYPPLTDLSEIQPYLPKGHPDKQFVLPENWYVPVTEENLEELRRWSGIEVNTTDLCGIVKWFNPIRFEVAHNTKGIIKKTGTYAYDFGQEITYEQFRKYVLKQQEEDYSYLIKLLEKWNIK